MKSFKYVITDPVGIHARPAGALVKEIKKYDSDVKVLANGKSADGKKLMNLMSLGVKQGNEIEAAQKKPTQQLLRHSLRLTFNFQSGLCS